MKNYVVHMTTCGGSVSQKHFTNKRKAKSFAWNWINAQKEIHRARANDRDYMELKVIVRLHYNDAYNNSDVVAYYG